MKDKTVIEALAEVYPQLYLDPNRVDKETYRSVVLAGEMPETRNLAHFRQSSQDSSETVETPAGRVQVVSIRDRGDYERLVRCMMAAKEGPLAPVPATQGASTLTVFNWPRIRAHQEKFLAEQRAAGNPDPDWSKEFQRFLSVKENYIDMLVVLSWGPYSAVPAEKAGWPEDSWLETSLAIRSPPCTRWTCSCARPTGRSLTPCACCTSWAATTSPCACPGKRPDAHNTAKLPLPGKLFYLPLAIPICTVYNPIKSYLVNRNLFFIAPSGAVRRLSWNC